MSFSEELQSLFRVMDEGSSVSAVAGLLGISVPRAYRLIRENRPGLVRRLSRTSLTEVHRALVVEEFKASALRAMGLDGVRRHSAETALLVILEGFLDLSRRVHHERPISHDRLAQRNAADEEDLEILSA